jgi:hypothetical protein
VILTSLLSSNLIIKTKNIITPKAYNVCAVNPQQTVSLRIL